MNQATKSGTKGSCALLALYVCEMIWLDLVLSIPSLPPPVASLFDAVAAVFAMLGLVVSYAVYRDAEGINERTGARVISGPFWSILTLLFSYVVVPLYILVPRRKALLKEGALRMMPQENGPMRVGPSIGFGAIFIGLSGVFCLVFGYYDLMIHSLDFYYPGTGPGNPGFEVPPTSAGVFLLVLGVCILVAVMITYSHRRTKSTR